MNIKKIHTPEGTQDICGREYSTKKYIENVFEDIFSLYGYMPVQSPSFEFLEVFSKVEGSSAENMLKFFDKNGKTLTLRPDFTPAIARIVSTKFEKANLPLRLYYMGNAFVDNESYANFRQKEFSQAGIECIGDGSILADAEVIAITINCLLDAGLRNFRIEIGHADFLKGIIMQSNFGDEDAEFLKHCLRKKDSEGVLTLLEKNKTKGYVKEIIKELSLLFGGTEILSKIKVNKLIELSKNAVLELMQICEIIEEYGLSKYIGIDLGFVNQYEYYSGTIFKGYIGNVGFPICSGGRYDNLIEKYGSLRKPSVGMALYTDRILMSLIESGKEQEALLPEHIVTYEEGSRKKAIDFALKLRKSGVRTELISNADLRELKKRGAKEISIVSEDTVQNIQCSDKKTVKRNGSK